MLHNFGRRDNMEFSWYSALPQFHWNAVSLVGWMAAVFICSFLIIFVSIMSVSTAPALQLEISHKQILKIALPISFALLVPQVNFITNNIFLGGLGERELGTAGLTGVYYLIFAAIGFGLNNGLQALISRRAGENRVEEIGKLFSQGVRMAHA